MYVQQTFQRRFNVAFRLIWRRDVTQRQINVETTLCFSTLNWTTLDNVETTLSFSTSIFTTLGNVETTLQIWLFEKKLKPRFKNKIIFLSFKEYAELKNLFFILRGTCKRTFAEPCFRKRVTIYIQIY